MSKIKNKFIKQVLDKNHYKLVYIYINWLIKLIKISFLAFYIIILLNISYNNIINFETIAIS